MAYIRQKSKNTWEIVIANGNSNGKRIRETFYFNRPEDLSDGQWNKILDEKLLECRLKVLGGRALQGRKIVCSQLSGLWIEDLKRKGRAPKTIFEYERYLQRINGYLGNYKITDIQPHLLHKFYDELKKPNVRENLLYKPTDNFLKFLKENNITAKDISQKGKINLKTAQKIIKGCTTNIAPQICINLEIPLNEAYEVINKSEPLSDRTVLHYHRALGSMFKFAVDNEYIDNNPIKRTTAPTVKSEEQRYLKSDEEFKMLLQHLDKEHIKHKTWIYIALMSGIRLGELGGLRWKDIDFESKTLYVTQALQALPGRGTFLKAPKNERSIRPIKLPTRAIQILEDYKIWFDNLRDAQGDRWIENGQLFTQKNGEKMYPSTPSQWFTKFRRKYNIADVNFHGLRHTHISHLIDSNFDLQSISARAGHARTETTSRVYSHLLNNGKDEELANAMQEKLDSFIQ